MAEARMPEGRSPAAGRRAKPAVGSSPNATNGNLRAAVTVELPQALTTPAIDQPLIAPPSITQPSITQPPLSSPPPEGELTSKLMELHSAICELDGAWDSSLPPPSDSFEGLALSPLVPKLRELPIEWFVQEERELGGEEPTEFDVIWSPVEIDGVEYLTLSDSELAAIGGLP